jgi:uridine phosphorylase
MMDKIKNELLNLGLKFMSVDEKIVKLFLKTSPSKINEIVILPAVKMVMKKIINKLQNKRVYGRVYNGNLNGVKVSVIRSLVGCPNCSIAVESLKRCKTKIIIRTDFCGGIENSTNNIHIGDLIVPKLAYCGDGTSPHYLMKYSKLLNQLEYIINPITKFREIFNEKIFISKPDDDLSSLLIKEPSSLVANEVKNVDLWTTDSLFCETEEFLEILRSVNVQGIDMESSILFLLGKLYNIKTASILSVSDLPGNIQYDMFKSNEIHPNIVKGIDSAISIVIKSLPKIKDLL